MNEGPVEDLIEQWKDDAEQIGIDMNTVWTQWTHMKVLITALERSPKASAHHEAFYLNTFVLKAVVDQVILGIRRQIDRDKRAHSLSNFLGALIRQPDVYSLDECIATFLERASRWDFVEPTRSQYEREAHELYAAVADASGIALDPKVMQRDLSFIPKSCRKMEAIANKHIAHNDRDKHEYQFTITELDEAVNGVKAVIRKYGRLFDGGGAGAGEPDIDEMLALYRFAWLEDDGVAQK